MDSEQKLKAQQVRQDYIRQRAKRDSLQEGLLPATLPDVIAGDPDGLLPVSALASDLQVRIPDWNSTAPPSFIETLVLEWRLDSGSDYTELSREDLIAPITETFPLERVIEQSHFKGREGLFQFRYAVRIWNDSVFDPSPEQPLTLDRTPPYDKQDPPAVQDPGQVNDSVLNADSGVWLTIPDFVEDKKEFVKVVIVWSDSVPPADQPIVPDVDILLPADRRVLIPRTLVERFASGDHYVAYELFDKAGNRSRTSRVQTVQVARGPLPVNLQAPVVPLAADGLIDLADARLGVTVEIPAFDNFHVNDEVVVLWGTTPLTPKRVGEGFPTFPVQVPVSWEHLKAEYTTGPDNQTVPVTYRVMRGTTPFPLPDSLGITVDVNLAYPGPVNPDEPDLVNPSLAPVVVKGASGTENHLIETDTGQAAIATITLYAPSAADEVITLYWKGGGVAETYTLDGTEAVGAPIDITVLWSEIEAGQSGDVPVFYNISHPDFVNEQQSANTLVQVDAVPIILEAPTFTDVSDVGGNFLLNCKSLRQRAGDGAIGYRVRVPDSAYLVAGEGVVMTWVLKEGSPEVDVPGSELVETLTIAADGQGPEWFVQPYATHILPAFEGTANKWAYGSVTYALTINGKVVRSEVDSKIVGLQDLSAPGNTCQLSQLPEIP